MTTRERQVQEIETIRPRNITLNLSNADCARISDLSGRYGITVSQLLESFVCDLVDGTYTNGSDERHLAEQYLERCFGLFNDDSLISHLTKYGYDHSKFLRFFTSLQASEERKKYIEEHPAEADEDDQYIDDDIEYWKSKVDEMLSDWKPDIEPNMDEEIEKLKKFVDERLELLHG